MYGPCIPFQTFPGQNIKGVRRISTNVYAYHDTWTVSAGDIAQHDLTPQGLMELGNFSYNIA